MRRTLYLKFILAYVIFGLFGFAVVATFISGMISDYLTKTHGESMYKTSIRIANTYASALYSSETSLDTVKNQLDALALYTGDTIWIINPSGTMVLDSSAAIDVDNQHIVNGFDPTVTGGSYYTIGDFFGSFDQEVLSVFAPITYNFKVQGYVVMHKTIASLTEETNQMLNIAYIQLLILFVLSLIILIFFTEVVYVPLRRITEATEQYASGNMHYEFTVESDDEMGYLAASLNYMANEIARTEDNQKKFVANVSHDFRSPLTSIHGYLEAMLDGTIPPELHEKYLQIVKNETERLTKLTGNLLTLNNLNVRGVVLNRTTFDINKVIRNCANTFEGICRGKGITIELVLTGDEMPVNADMDKIQQVIYNLLDNAVKFSHHNSIIKVETVERKSKIFISVKDSGIGIPKEDQKLIFDRFYKSDSSRGKDKKGTGLGLSIVKEIIGAHNEHINVISTEGVGTEFTFSLPIVYGDEE